MTGEEARDVRQQPADATLDPRVLEEIVRRVVEVARPERIILFGSAARGQMGPHRSAVTARIYGRLRGEHAAVDVIVVTPDDVARYGDSHALVIKPALREGQVVYEAP